MPHPAFIRDVSLLSIVDMQAGDVALLLTSLLYSFLFVHAISGRYSGIAYEGLLHSVHLPFILCTFKRPAHHPHVLLR
jgi:hypothetical protein